MAKNGPIIIIEDDSDDQLLLEEALMETAVSNELIFFENGKDAYNFLKETKKEPFLIFCDVNLPKQNGIEFKCALDEDPEMRAKSIPFLFYTTYVSQYALLEAYKNLTVQGFFQKNNSYGELKEIVKTIINYWKICMIPTQDALQQVGKNDHEQK